MKQDYCNKHIVVVGAGKSGIALARHLSQRGAQVTLSDQRAAGQIRDLGQLDGLSISYDLGGHNIELFKTSDLIAISPGVPTNAPPLVEARKHGVSVVGEIEIAARELTAPVIAVTGTNGKSTTTSLIGEVLKQQSGQVFVGGNLGTPLLEACDSGADAVVVELSSFQLETIDQFRPDIALLLNLSSDHLDRYNSLDEYYAAKLRIFNNLGEGAFAVLNADDNEVCRLCDDLSGQQIWFSARGRDVRGLVRRGSSLFWNVDSEELTFDLTQLQLRGEHNVENAMAALVAVLLHGCDPQQAWKSICAYAGLEHRTQLVAQINGVDYYNDSKGTNVGSVVKSLEGFTSVILIAGGKDKGGDYAPLIPVLKERVKQLILIGQATERMTKELAGACPIRKSDDMSAAVVLAADTAESGDVVLLSPACSSFDMYDNFEQRGDDFTRLVHTLVREELS